MVFAVAGALEPHHCRRYRLGWREHKGDSAHDLRRSARCISPGATGAGVSAFQAAAFVLGEPAKHAGLLTGPQRTPGGSQRPDTDGRWPWRHLCGAARGP